MVRGLLNNKWKLRDLVCLMLLSLFILPNSVYSRRIKTPDDTLAAERKVADIFEEVVKQAPQNQFGPRLPPYFLKVYAKLITSGVPKAEEIIRKKFVRFLDHDIYFSAKLRKAELNDPKIRQAYEKVKDFYLKNLDFDGNGFVLYEDFVGHIRIAEDIRERWGNNLGMYLFFYDVILLNEHIQSRDYLHTIIHEALHWITGHKFRSPTLNEGITDFLTLELAGENIYLICPHLIEIIKNLIEVVGKSKLMEAYIKGSFEPFRGKLSDKAIELLELSEMYTSVYRLGYVPHSAEDLIKYIIENRDSEVKLEELKKKILFRLYEEEVPDYEW